MSMIQSVRGAVLCFGLVCMVGACGDDPAPQQNVAGAPVFTGGAPAVGATGGAPGATGGAPAVGATGGAPGAGVGTTGGAPAVGATGGAPAATGGAPAGTGGMMAGGACVTGVKTAQMNMAKEGCAECICMKDPMADTKCDAACWALIGCIGDKCMGDGMNIACILGMCMTELAPGQTMATAFGPTAAMCKTECTK